jgi:hypothetical protein
MNIALQPAAEMGSRLLAVVESENTFDFAMQFVGKVNRSGAAAIRAAIVFESFKINSEGAVELGNSTGENHGPSSGTFLHDDEAVRSGKFLYLFDIARFGSELLGKFLTFDVRGPPACAVEILESIT